MGSGKAARCHQGGHSGEAALRLNPSSATGVGFPNLVGALLHIHSPFNKPKPSPPLGLPPTAVLSFHAILGPSFN